MKIKNFELNGKSITGVEKNISVLGADRTNVKGVQTDIYIPCDGLHLQHMALETGNCFSYAYKDEGGQEISIYSAETNILFVALSKYHTL